MVEVLAGPGAGTQVAADHSVPSRDRALALRAGDAVVVTKTLTGTETVHYVVDRFRLPALGGLFGFFVALAIG